MSCRNANFTTEDTEKTFSRCLRVLCVLRGLILLLGIFPTFALAQATQETRAFDAAIRSFQLATYDRAQNELATFIEQFPASPKIPEALLLQAQCPIRLKQLQ